VPDLDEEILSFHIARSHRATDFGSNRTQVPMRNDGILPAFACLKTVIFETVNMLASSFAVKARPIRSILSGSDIGSAELLLGLHDCIYLLCGFTCGNCRTLLLDLWFGSNNHMPGSASTEGIAPVLISTVFASWPESAITLSR
jgi:hypothetical protein